MDVETALAQIGEILRELEADAYARGERNALERIVAAATSIDRTRPATMPVGIEPSLPREKRQRAPWGLVGVLVDRELAHGEPLSPDDIKARARDDDERMIAVTSIRAHLRKGTTENRYRAHMGGRWSLAAAAGAESTVASPAGEDAGTSADAAPDTDIAA